MVRTALALFIVSSGVPRVAAISPPVQQNDQPVVGGVDTRTFIHWPLA